MPRYKNNKPSILGLAFKSPSDGTPGVAIAVQPGEVFEADASSIPKVYLDQRWIVPTTEPITPSAASAPGVTDLAAALSGAYGEAARTAAIEAQASAPAEPPPPTSGTTSTTSTTGTTGTTGTTSGSTGTTGTTGSSTTGTGSTSTTGTSGSTGSTSGTSTTSG